MVGNSEKSSLQYSKKLALCAVMAGLGTAALLTGGLIPVATYCAPMLAGLVLIPMRLECGKRWGWLCWAASALLAIALSADREAAFFYVFVGWYPLVKPGLDRLKNGFLRLLVKTLLFTVSTGVLYAFLCLILRIDAVVESFGGAGKIANAAFFALLIACMLLYDRALVPLTQLYRVRLRPKLRFLR